ncbi:MAG: hypothetical protein ACLQPD_03030 [Desulfomonilaceae bacterium]
MLENAVESEVRTIDELIEAEFEGYEDDEGVAYKFESILDDGKQHILQTIKKFPHIKQRALQIMKEFPHVHIGTAVTMARREDLKREQDAKRAAWNEILKKRFKGKKGRSQLSDLVTDCVFTALRDTIRDIELCEIDPDERRSWKGDIVGGLETTIFRYTESVFDECIRPNWVAQSAKRRLENILSDDDLREYVFAQLEKNWKMVYEQRAPEE